MPSTVLRPPNTARHRVPAPAAMPPPQASLLYYLMTRTRFRAILLTAAACVTTSSSLRREGRCREFEPRSHGVDGPCRVPGLASVPYTQSFRKWLSTDSTPGRTSVSCWRHMDERHLRPRHGAGLGSSGRPPPPGACRSWALSVRSVTWDDPAHDAGRKHPWLPALCCPQ